ncbi:MAG: hypothetical protein HRU07_05695 [Nitrosopumilus sp.]|nr:MT-A70 family methyltransferase [Nitrosopumilus sp.]NRA05639.1 hypothetical protein [Nitrosopumilus sp.]
MQIQTLHKSKIKISKKYQNAVARQTKDERKTMQESIIKHGIRKELEISKLTGLLVDGQERYEVGLTANIEEFPIVYKDFDSELAEFQYVIDNSRCRRNLTTWWIGKLNRLNLELEKKLAKQRQQLGKTPTDNLKHENTENTKNNHTSVQICTKGAKIENGRSSELATKGSGISARTQDTVSRIIEYGDKDLIKKLDDGELTTHKAETIIIQKEIEKTPILPLPIGKFTDIVEDPGWLFANKNIGGSGKSGAGMKYRVLPTKDIAKIPVESIAADNAVNYMWTTNSHLVTGSMLMSEYIAILEQQKFEIKIKNLTDKEKIKEIQNVFCERVLAISDMLGKIKVQSDALSVINCHGFTPKYIITWEKKEKEGWGGYGFNNVTEHLLIGIRGKIKPFGLQEKTIVKSKYVPRTHSRKPEEMWELIEKCVGITRGNHRKLEMNCRTPRKGWLPQGDAITEKDIKKWQKFGS